MIIYIHICSHMLNHLLFLVRNIFNEYGSLSTYIIKSHPLGGVVPCLIFFISIILSFMDTFENNNRCFRSNFWAAHPMCGGIICIETDPILKY